MTGDPHDGDPHIVVAGAGAIGSLVAAHLVAAGRSVTVIDGWYPHVEAMRANGVVIEAPDETIGTPVPAHHIDEVDTIDRPADLLLVASKAQESAVMLGLTSTLRSPETVVLPLQNGMTQEWFTRMLGGRSRLLGAAVHVPAELVGPGRVRRYLPRGRRTLSVGPQERGASRLAHQVAELLMPAGQCDVATDLAAVKWAKLAVNTMTNAPAGLTGWTTGRLWSDARSVPLVARAAGETLAVAHAAGVEVAPVYGRLAPARFRQALHDAEIAEEVHEAIREMGAERVGASESRPSLLQDVDRGRRTEVAYLNGYVVARGRELGVATPVNEALARLVMDMDRGLLEQHPDHIDVIERETHGFTENR